MKTRSGGGEVEYSGKRNISLFDNRLFTTGSYNGRRFLILSKVCTASASFPVREFFCKRTHENRLQCHRHRHFANSPLPYITWRRSRQTGSFLSVRYSTRPASNEHFAGLIIDFSLVSS